MIPTYKFIGDNQKVDYSKHLRQRDQQLERLRLELYMKLATLVAKKLLEDLDKDV